MNKEFMVGLAFGGAILGYAYSSLFKNEEVEEIDPDKPARRITEEELSKYSGQDMRACYVSLNEKIYDVTKKKAKFVNAGLGGKVLNREDGSLKSEFSNIGLSVAEIEKSFPKVGLLLVMKEYTKEELAKYRGVGDEPCYVSAKGLVFDVDKSFYGPDAPYGAFAGRDASRALAKMSLEPEDLDSSKLDDLTWSEKTTLNEWVAKFETKYVKVGTLKGYVAA